jgi:hypothetical protein
MVLGSIISAGAGLIGGLVGSNNSSNTSRDINNANINQSREFAQNSISWRVADAERAGVHPLYALGAPSVSFNPAHVGDNSGGILAKSLSGAGQDIGRAVNQGLNREARELQEMQLKSATLDMEGKAIDNQLRAERLRQMRNNAPTPTGTSSVTGNSLGVPGQNSVKVNRSEVTASMKGRPGADAGMQNSIQYRPVVTSKGHVVQAYPEDDLLDAEGTFVGLTAQYDAATAPPPPSSALPPGYAYWTRIGPGRYAAIKKGSRRPASRVARELLDRIYSGSR